MSRLTKLQIDKLREGFYIEVRYRITKVEECHYEIKYTELPDSFSYDNMKYNGTYRDKTLETEFLDNPNISQVYMRVICKNSMISEMKKYLKISEATAAEDIKPLVPSGSCSEPLANADDGDEIVPLEVRGRKSNCSNCGYHKYGESCQKCKDIFG